MRLGRLVAAGLVAGAVAGFVGALLRPRTVQTYRPDADRPATGARGDLAGVRSVAVPESRTVEPASGPVGPGRSQDYALATSARDEGPDGLSGVHSDDDSTGGADDEPGVPGAGESARTVDVDAEQRQAEARLAAAPSRGANG